MQETTHQKAQLQGFAPHHRVLNLYESRLPFPSSSSSPICSRHFQISSSDSDTFYTDVASQLPSPRKQSIGNSCIESNNCSSCYYEIEEWLEHANRLCKPTNFMTRYHSSSDCGDSLDQNRRTAGVKMSMSSICKKLLDHELYSHTGPSVIESTAYESQSRLACTNSMHEREQGRRQLLNRPKPYNTYLNEIEMQKLEAERDSWKRARHLELLKRMRRKEAAIDDLELEQTRIAVEKMKTLQQKLLNEFETKQLEIAAKTQKKICLLKQKAEKQKKNLRLTTIDKISTTRNISEANTNSCRGLFTCLKLRSFC
ncbi:hypothetical protein K1719_018088 [Acacia pycnantha]|nr:hypothetical protein K1719_018088 [Acacia pycnantha]